MSVELQLKEFLKIGLLLLLVFCCCSKSQAQDDIPVRQLPNEIFRTVAAKNTKDTVQWLWKHGGSSTVNYSQTNQTNWAAGGDRTAMSLTAYINAFLLYKKDRYYWDNNIDINVGYLYTTSNGGRKNADKFDYLTKSGYRFDSSGKLSLSLLVNPRSQFFVGRTYYSKDSSIISSSFLSPLYLTSSIGLDYQPTSDFSIFLSPISSRLTGILNPNVSQLGLYGVAKGKRLYSELGAFSSISFHKTVLKNIDYKGRLDVFSNYLGKPLNLNIYNTNIVTFKVNKIISATYSLTMIYDDAVKLFGPNNDSPGLQLQSILGIGVALPFKTGYTLSNKGSSKAKSTAMKEHS